MRAPLVIVLLNIFAAVLCREPKEPMEPSIESVTSPAVPGNTKITGERPMIDSCAACNQSGVYQLAHPAVTVYCEMNALGGGWLVIQQRVDRNLNFYRNWQDYRDGFGVVGEGASFWLGNEAVHQITTKDDFELAIEWKHGRLPNREAIHSRFRLAGEDDKYRLTVGGHSGDNFGFHDQAKFSTYNNDNDLREGQNCADRERSGWWFGSPDYCGKSNLNHHMGPKYWSGLVGTFSRMMIRRK